MKYYLTAGLYFLLIYLFLTYFSTLFVRVSCYFLVFRLLWSLFVFVQTFGFTKRKFLTDEVDPYKKAVFISGCDTGFGNQLAGRLDAKGFLVFAGCLDPHGDAASSLKGRSSGRLKIVPLDVTKDQDVESAAEYVKENLGPCRLWAVVNNAGIHKGFNIEDTGLNEFRDTIEVNAFGPVRVTKVFLPMLKETKGRIVTVTSMIGRTVLPFFTPYCVSKAAAVSFVDCLRQEIAQYGIQVISIEPGMFQTNLTKKSLVEERINYTFDSEKLKKEDLPQRLASMKKITDFFLSFASPDTDVVVNDMENAVISKYPDTVYAPRRDLKWRIFLWLLLVLPVDIRDALVRIFLEFHKRFL